MVLRCGIRGRDRAFSPAWTAALTIRLLGMLVIVDDFAPLQFLRPGEQLLWHGKPDPAVWFTPADLYVIPVSVLWCGFAIFWEAGVSGEGGPVAGIWGIPFVAAGLYFVFGRFFGKRYPKRRTVYAITTQRALVVTGGRELVDAPWGQRPVLVRRSRDARHASVILDSGGTRAPGRRNTGTPENTGLSVLLDSGGTRAPGRRNMGMPGNTGLDIGPWRAGAQVAFYDVADPEPMLAALDQARGSRARSDDSWHVP